MAEGIRWGEACHTRAKELLEEALDDLQRTSVPHNNLDMK